MTKNYILYCSIHTRWLEQTNLQKNKVDEWLPRMQSSGAGGREVPVNGYRISFRGNGNVLKLDCVRVAQACARHGAKNVLCVLHVLITSVVSDSLRLYGL